MKIMNRFFRSRLLHDFQKIPSTSDNPDYDGLLWSNRQSFHVEVRFSSNQQKQ